MKDSNSMETQMRSWPLRQPSRKVEQAVFGKPERRTHHARHHWQGGWAAGFATCAMLLLTALNMAHFSGVPGSMTFIVPAAISNASYAASFAAVQHNCVSAPIFGFTNDSELHSSIRSLDLLNTNLLR